MERSERSPERASEELDALARTAARGDRRALEDLLRRLLPRTRNLVRYLVRGDSDVDDIAQKALFAVVRGLPSWRGDGKLTSWTDRITAREAFAHVSKERAERRSRERETFELHAVPAPGARPDDYVVRRELATCLDELPPEQRHALVLHHVVGMSVPELADELAIPAETARSRLRLGIKKLRERFEGDADGDGRGGDA